MQRAVAYGTYFSARLKYWAHVANAWRTSRIGQLNAYHPEKHYMRGPGPKCRARRDQYCGRD